MESPFRANRRSPLRGGLTLTLHFHYVTLARIRNRAHIPQSGSRPKRKGEA